MVTRPGTRAQVKVKNFIIADSFSCQVEKGHVTDSILGVFETPKTVKSFFVI